MIYFIAIVILLVEGIFSNFVTYLPFVFPLKLFLFSLFYIFLIILDPSQKKKLVITSLVMGLMYDLFYTNTYFLHSVYFLIIYIVISFLLKRRFLPSFAFIIGFIVFLNLEFLGALLLYGTSIKSYLAYFVQMLFCHLIFLILGFIYFQVSGSRQKRYVKLN